MTRIADDAYDGVSPFAASDYEEIIQRLKSGNREAWEEAAAIIDSFPHGMIDDRGFCWISLAAAVGSLDAVKWMIEMGVDLNRPAPDGFTPLHECLYRQDQVRHDVMALLMAAKANVNIRGTQDWTPLHLAAIRDDQKAIKC